jgi:hypothetical protein
LGSGSFTLHMKIMGVLHTLVAQPQAYWNVWL